MFWPSAEEVTFCQFEETERPAQVTPESALT
jgi:hypothetical protein